jgi:molecular chaperone GrpE
MSAKHESRAASERKQDSGVEQTPEAAPQPEVPAGEPEAPIAPAAATDNAQPEAPIAPAATTDDAGEPEAPAAATDNAQPEAPIAPAATTDNAGEPEAPAAATGSPDGDTAAPLEADHEVKLERDLDELTARAKMADEYLELAQRTKADFENYRKRAARESAAALERGVAKLAKELLPAVDNLDRALAAAQTAQLAAAQTAQDGQTDSNGSLADGIKLVHADVIAALARVGIEPFSPDGEQFDPQHHEAVAQHPVQGAQPGTIVEVYQRGYRLGESVLRPARVVVAG